MHPGPIVAAGLAWQNARRMGFYERQVLPRIFDRVLSNAEIEAYRARATPGLHGQLVEIGFGSGLNLPHYPAEVQRVLAVDPSAVGYGLAQRRIAACHAQVDLVAIDGARLPLDTASADSALSTLTLCSIPDVQAALAELRRVLKPGGSLHFFEHGRSSDPGVARWQDRLNPLQKRLAGGCHLNRDIPALLEAAGFELQSLENTYMRGPRVMTCIYEGRALSP